MAKYSDPIPEEKEFTPEELEQLAQDLESAEKRIAALRSAEDEDDWDWV